MNTLPAEFDVNADYYAYHRRVREGLEPRIGYTPVDAGPIRERVNQDNPAEPRTDGEPFRRFAIFETETKLYICELAPTRRFPVNWTDGAMTRESAWRVAQSSQKTVVLPDGTEVQIYDEAIADERAYSFWCGVEASYSDAAYYAPLSFEAWCRAGKPDPYTNRPYTEAKV